MSDTTEIEISNGPHKRKVTVPVVYRFKSVVVHQTHMQPTFTVSNESCGFAYKIGLTKFQARAFADYIAGVPELANIKSPEDTLRLKKENSKVIRAMKDHFAEITGRDW